MATLHVRNVPDELYELLRERAAANDRSIGAETVQLLQERLALAGYGPPPRRFPLPGGRRRGSGTGTGLFTRFTTEARAVVVAAQEQARELGHDHVGTEHLLLGVLAGDVRTPLLRMLKAAGLTTKNVREEIERSPGKGDAEPAGQIPFQPAAKQALELALREALKLGDGAITPDHILLGVLDQKSGRGAELVRALARDAVKLRADLLAVREPLPGGPSGSMLFRPSPSFRVVLLEGDADAWEQQLNDAAALGFDLVEIVDRRAILRRF